VGDPQLGRGNPVVGQGVGEDHQIIDLPRLARARRVAKIVCSEKPVDSTMWMVWYAVGGQQDGAGAQGQSGVGILASGHGFQGCLVAVA